MVLHTGPVTEGGVANEWATALLIHAEWLGDETRAVPVYVVFGKRSLSLAKLLWVRDRAYVVTGALAHYTQPGPGGIQTWRYNIQVSDLARVEEQNDPAKKRGLTGEGIDYIGSESCRSIQKEQGGVERG